MSNKKYAVTLKSPVSTTFRCQKAANSLDIDTEKKSVHAFSVQADIESDFNVGLIVGASGSGKTTLAKQIYGEDVFISCMQPDLPVIDQFPEELTYDECVSILTGVGLTSVPCWIRPVYTLSNGQKARAKIALMMAKKPEMAVVDEWTSVVDRNAAKVMSYCIQKHTRRTDTRIVLLSCHYDVIEWLNPDWVIDCNKSQYIDRRSLRRDFERKEKLSFEVRRADRSSWRNFSKYHYLSENLPGGHVECFGLFSGNDQIGFCCFANYVPWADRTKAKKMHSNRVVIHPDYAGLGLGIRFVNECAVVMAAAGFDVFAKLSAAPLIRARQKQPENWRLLKVERRLKIPKTGNMKRDSGFRMKVKTCTFKWIGTKTARHHATQRATG